jgi:AcrR family transcriptional regulator
MQTGRPRSFDRDQALRKAMHMFWTRGFEATSIADLCAEMGISPPSLYGAFGSKEQLYEECISCYMQTVASKVWDGFNRAFTAYEAIHAFLSDSATQLPALDKPAGCMVTLSSAGEGGNERLGDLVEDARRQGQAALERRIQSAIAGGEISDRADPRTIARFYLCVQQGMSILARDGADRDQLQTVADVAMAGWPKLVRPD